ATTHYSSFASQAQSADINYLLPSSAPLANQVLTANSISGTGPYTITMVWATPTGSGGGGTGWALTGNTSTVDGTNYLGTTDNVPFTIRVNSNRAFRIQPASQAPSFSKV